jgi:hypothetical protein
MKDTGMMKGRMRLKMRTCLMMRRSNSPHLVIHDNTTATLIHLHTGTC